MAQTKDIRVNLKATNYDEIKSLQPMGFNRELSPSSLKKLEKSMIQHGFKSVILVVMTKAFGGGVQFFNVDGQHRLAVAKKLNIPFKYLLVSFSPEEDTKLNVCKLIADLNSNSVKWTPSKYLNMYAKLGFDSYVTMKEVLKETKLTITDLQNIFMFGCGEKEVDAFKNGNMVFKNKKKSLQLKDAIVYLRNVIPNYSYIRRSLFTVFKEAKGEYMTLAEAIKKESKKGMPENEKDLLPWLVKIKDKTFPKAMKVAA